VFPLVADPAAWGNYLRVTNRGGTMQEVHITAYDAGGTLIDTSVFPLTAGMQLQTDVTWLFPGQNVAWLRVEAPQPSLVGDLLYVAYDLSRMSCYLGIDAAVTKGGKGRENLSE
jgi:hypothetical protein